MSKKTLLILLGVSVGGCCLFGTGSILVLGLLAPEPGDMNPVAAPATTATATVAGGNAKLGGYLIYGRSTPMNEGFADSLVGNWMLMDGAAVDSIESIHNDYVEVKRSRTGELWHFTFEDGGSYSFRYLISGKFGQALWVEKGEYTSDGNQLTLSPSECLSKANGSKEECLESTPRTYQLTTVRMDELTPDERVGANWVGLRLTGPFPSWSQGPNPYSYRELQRVQ